ncbi:MAG TPA: glycosyltransferase family 4 protein [Gaiellaceae bacterium]
MSAEALRRAARRVASIAGGRWAPYSKLFFVGEGVGWVIDEEQRAVSEVAERIGIDVVKRLPPTAARAQSAFYGSHFTFFDHEDAVDASCRIAITYFHGLPGTPDAPEFDRAFAALQRLHDRIDRVQVSHREVEDLVLSSGIDPRKVFRIPIGIEPRFFRRRTPEARAALGLPEDAFVVGSFQKDGVGWDDGLEPKPIKGPDVLVAALVALRQRVPRLHVLLSGPARGFVKVGLDAAGIPYVHRAVERYDDIGSLYAGLDAYVVTSRQEGGPKGVLEAMAAGVPLVSTRVGQAVDLVRDGENGWLVDVGDVEGIVDRLASIAAGDVDVERVVRAGRATAEENSYAAQLPLWESFFDGFVER